MKILTIVGARPQFVKAAAVSRAVIACKGAVSEKIVHTGQHYDKNMSDIFFEQMAIPKPDYFLDIHGLTHGAMTGQMLQKIEEVIQKESPDIVLVYGDTNTTLAGALAAVKLHVPVAHVEAGLRSFNRAMPEEINRLVTDHVANVLFCPTSAAIENLEKEGIAETPEMKIGPGFRKINMPGDVMLDCALYYARDSQAHALVYARGKPLYEILEKQGALDDFALCTMHRAENTDDEKRCKGIIAALLDIAPEKPVVFPVHPRTRKAMERFGMDPAKESNRFHMIDPVGYFDMLELLKRCSLVLTDSGGLQKEAYFFKKPCVTMRDETEWVELVEKGANMLAGANRDAIGKAGQVMSKKEIGFDLGLYGNGEASRKIVSVLAELF